MYFEKKHVSIRLKLPGHTTESYCFSVKTKPYSVDVKTYFISEVCDAETASLKGLVTFQKLCHRSSVSKS